MIRRNVKSIILGLFLGMVSTAAFAASPADGDNLFVWTKGAKTAVVYSLDNLDKITFDDAAVSVWTNKGNTDYAYGNIALLTFRDGVKPVTGVELLTAVESDVRISYDRETQLVSVDGNQPVGGIIVCDLQGRVVARVSRVARQLHLSLADLPQGVYIVKPQGTTKSVKIIK